MLLLTKIYLCVQSCLGRREMAQENSDGLSKIESLIDRNKIYICKKMTFEFLIQYSPCVIIFRSSSGLIDIFLIFIFKSCGPGLDLKKIIFLKKLSSNSWIRMKLCLVNILAFKYLVQYSPFVIIPLLIWSSLYFY